MSEIIYSPSVGLTQLVLPDAPELPPTGNRETDALGAVTRGLAEYLGQVYIEGWLGTRLYAAQVYDQAMRAQERNVYPAVFVLPPAGDAPLGNEMINAPPVKLPEPDGRYLAGAATLTFRLQVVVETINQPQCQGMTSLVLQALSPFLLRAGLQLDLPHYHNMRADFLWVGYGKNESDPDRNRYSQALIVDAQVPLVLLYAADSIRIGPVVPYITVELPVGAEQSYVIDNQEWPRRVTRCLGLPGTHVASPPLPL